MNKYYLIGVIHNLINEIFNKLDKTYDFNEYYIWHGMYISIVYS